jgi:uncharacterized membrane protein
MVLNDQYTIVRKECSISMRKQTWHRYGDLLLLIALCISVATLVYLAPDSPFRVASGALCIFYAPGYALLAALYPDKKAINRGQRFSGGVGLSVVTSSLLMLVMTYSVGTSLHSSLGVLVFWIVVMVLIAWNRRSRISPPECFTLRLSIRLPTWQERGFPNKWMSLAQILAILVLGLTAARLLWVSSHTSPQFAEFYVLGPDGVAGEYPEEAIVDELVFLILGVVNHEHSNVQYRIEMTGDGGTKQIATLSLGHEEKWEQPYTFTLAEPGENRKVTFLLYKGDEKEPYRSLHLWITVRE